MNKKIGFICIHNTYASQIAEGLANKLGLNAYSAGLEDYPQVQKYSVQVNEEIGVNMNDHYPKALSDLPTDLDIVIYLNCEASSIVKAKYHESWLLNDLDTKTIEAYRLTRDELKALILDLKTRIEEGKYL